jgi:hypothetical protein
MIVSEETHRMDPASSINGGNDAPPEEKEAQGAGEREPLREPGASQQRHAGRSPSSTRLSIDLGALTTMKSVPGDPRHGTFRAAAEVCYHALARASDVKCVTWCL